jgi:selenocysteine lyase/cysteine desulfurase
VIYLDHAATGLPRRPEALAAAIEAAGLGNPGRGLHAVQRAAREELEAARQAVAALAGSGVVCFTSGATVALNQAILGWRPRPRCVAIAPLLHNAVYRPLRASGAALWPLPHDGCGRIDLARVAASWVAGTSLVVVGHGCNVTGLMQPVAELVELAHARQAAVVVDCAQTAGLQVPLEVGAADALAWSAHKGLRALPGAGVLVVCGDAVLEPLLHGGTGFDAAAEEMPGELPQRLEAGTPNLPGIAALGRAAASARAETWDWRGAAAALAEAVQRGGAVIVGRGELPIVSFRLPGVAPRLAEEMLDRACDIVVRAGLHCAPLAHRLLGTLAEGTVRASAGSCTGPGELEMLGRALQEIARHGGD